MKIKANPTDEMKPKIQITSWPLQPPFGLDDAAADLLCPFHESLDGKDEFWQHIQKHDG
jgi:hypothetical protein